MELTAQNPEGRRRCRVLIAEDNEKNLKLFKLIICYLGYETITARNGEEAVSIAKGQRPDLILMDIQMPVMDGVTAVDLLKADEDTRGIPVIALTSYAMKGDREKFLEHGFIDYIAKPVSKDALIKAVKKALGKEMTD